MKRFRLVTLLLMLSLIFACLVSSPVLSGENPWDSDNEGEEVTPSDTLKVFEADSELIRIYRAPEQPEPSWFENFYLAAKIQLSLLIVAK